MKPNVPNLSNPSLLQMMKGVIFFAVAFACVSPMLHLWRIGLVEGGSTRGLVVVAIFEAVVVPLVWIVLAFVLIPRGSMRDAMITNLLLCSVSVVLGTACWLFFSYTFPAYRSPYERVGVSFLTRHALLILMMAAATLFLSRQLWRCYRTGTASKRGELGEPHARSYRHSRTIGVTLRASKRPVETGPTPSEASLISTFLNHRSDPPRE